jgi:hypothetical protein
MFQPSIDNTLSRSFQYSIFNKHRVTGCFNLQLTTPYHDLLNIYQFHDSGQTEHDVEKQHSTTKRVKRKCETTWPIVPALGMSNLVYYCQIHMHTQHSKCRYFALHSQTHHTNPHTFIHIRSDARLRPVIRLIDMNVVPSVITLCMYEVYLNLYIQIFSLLNPRTRVNQNNIKNT